jgi:alcohol dehydrogenase
MLGKELHALGLTRPAILTQPMVARLPEYEAAIASLQSLPRFESKSIPPHSSVALIETITEEITSFGADCLVAIGGGSVVDSAKAVALLLAEGGRLANHATRFTPPSTVQIPRLTRSKLPIIAMPTTASGAEATSSFGVRDDTSREKLMFWNRQVAATAILIDPALSSSTPLATLRFTAMNGIAHCLEALYSKGRSAVSDSLSLHGLGLFQQALSTTAMDEPTQRRLLMLAGHQGGLALGMARSALHHAICHVIGARTGLGHGLVNTVVLPHAIAFNEAAVADLLAPALGVVNRQSGREHASVSCWLSELAQEQGFPVRLSALGVSEDDLEPIARHVMTERGLALNPRPVADWKEIHGILKLAF